MILCLTQSIRVISISICIETCDVCVFCQGLTLTRHVLSELGVQLGLCKPTSPEIEQMVYDYLNVIKTRKEGKTRETNEGRCWAKVSQHSRSP